MPLKMLFVHMWVGWARMGVGGCLQKGRSIGCEPAQLRDTNSPNSILVRHR